MKTKIQRFILSVVAVSIVFAGVFSPKATFAAITPGAELPGLGNCSQYTMKIDGPGPVTYTAASPITSLFIKAGSQNQEDSGCFPYTQDTNDGCYSIVGIGTTTVTVTKVGDGPDCKDISHVEFSIAVVDVTPTATPSAEPTPTVDPSPTPTANPTPTSGSNPAATPTPGNSNNGSSNTVSTSSNTTTTSTAQQKRGEVLGASTLAYTGNSLLSFAYMLQLMGILLASIGVKVYGKNS